jgi:hypothetical protein
VTRIDGVKKAYTSKASNIDAKQAPNTMLNQVQLVST